jgi:iron complex transport system substrate-binding protein
MNEALHTALPRWRQLSGLPAGAAVLVALLSALLAPTSAGAAVTLTDDRGRQVVFDRPALRVVTLLPSLTETVCELQACDRLVGTDRYSNWPASVLALPKLGGLEDTQLERIVSLKPDLVLAAVSSRVIDRLESLGLRVLALEAKTLPETRRVIDTVAAALGKPGQGELLWAQVERRISAAAARVPSAMQGQRVYFEVSSAPYAAGESSFVGEMLARLGLGNVAPAALGPFPKLNPEFVVRAQPDLVMASERNLAEMLKRPGWDAITALRRQRSCGFAEARYEVLIRPGPRLAEAAELVADCLTKLRPETAVAPLPGTKATAHSGQRAP